MRKIKLVAGLVCPRRSLDYKKLEKYFLANNCELTSDPNEATDIILITCAFIERSIQEGLKLIKILKKCQGRLVVGGCLSDIDSSRLSEIFNGDIFTTKNIDLIDNYFPEFGISINDIDDANTFHDYEEVNSILGDRKRNKVIEQYYINPYRKDKGTFTIRIGFGCNCKCSYCSHRNAIGKYRSKSIEDCIKEFEAGYNKEFRIFKLTSMDTGYYGRDIKSSLPQLMKIFLDIHHDISFYLDDINPMWVVKYRDVFTRLYKHNLLIGMQSPIQTGSKPLLRKMNRNLDYEKAISFFSEYKIFNKDNVLATEIIVGFPTETMDDFKKTIDFIHQSKIEFVYIYPYYENQYVDSKDIFPKCTEDEKCERIKYAIESLDKFEISYNIFLDYFSEENSKLIWETFNKQ